MSGGGDDDSDLSATAWPGFVDILSSVIIMFVFFVLIVASALFFHMVIFKSKILSEAAKSSASTAQMQELASTNRSLSKKIKEMEETDKIIEEVNNDVDVQLYQEQTEFSESLEQRLIEDTNEKSFTVFFGKDSISVTEESLVEVDKIIKSYESKFDPEKIQVKILAGKNPKSVNDVVARRLAVARMLNVRNSFLISNIPSANIDPSIPNNLEEIDGTFNWVKVVFSVK